VFGTFAAAIGKALQQSRLVEIRAVQALVSACNVALGVVAAAAPSARFSQVVVLAEAETNRCALTRAIRVAKVGVETGLRAGAFSLAVDETGVLL
jgi:hypothetical protein